MTIPPEIVNYITKYGYVAIFSIVFLQEIGIPNPIATEIFILFSGYLAYAGTLNIYLVFITVVAADFIGTSILYAIFYLFGDQLFKRLPHWLPVEKINSIKERILKRGKRAVYIGRLLPYIRAYTSIAAGLLKIPPSEFLTAVLLSAITWSGGFAILGMFLGPAWQDLMTKVGLGNFFLILIVVVMSIFFLWSKISKLIKNKRRVI